MPIIVAAPVEVNESEKRVGIVPDVADKIRKLNLTPLIEAQAGHASQFTDKQYCDVGIADSPESLYGQADIILKVQPPTLEEIELCKEGAQFICFLAPYQAEERFKLMQRKNITSFAMELIPRISRAQSIDALSSQASIAGYKAVLLAANNLGKFLPMLTTAAGTIRPSKVLVIGAGVAGLQAIATAKRMGAMVEAYDVRPEVKEQIESLGAKFVDIEIKASGKGGYARELTPEEKQQQQEILATHVSQADILLTTAAIPGKPSPKIISTEMVEQMQPGSVIVDLAAEGGGNCTLTQPGLEVFHQGVCVYGPLNIPSMIPRHSSEMYSKNLFNFLKLVISDGQINLNWQDEILSSSVITHGGEIRFQPLLKQTDINSGGAAA